MAPGGPLWPSLWTGTQGFSISLHSHSGLFSAAPGRINQLYLISFYTQINCHSSHSYEFPLISRNISPKLESFPPQIAAPSPLWPADSIKIDGPLITQTISWNHSLNGLKWSHLTNMGCEAFEMEKHCPISHFEIFVTFVTFLTRKICTLQWLEMRIHIKSRLPEWPLV